MCCEKAVKKHPASQRTRRCDTCSDPVTSEALAVSWFGAPDLAPPLPALPPPPPGREMMVAVYNKVQHIADEGLVGRETVEGLDRRLEGLARSLERIEEAIHQLTLHSALVVDIDPAHAPDSRSSSDHSHLLTPDVVQAGEFTQ